MGFESALYYSMSKDKDLTCRFKGDKKKGTWDEILSWMSMKEKDEVLDMLSLAYWDYE